MSYNFKSIADVEVVETPTDKANVLIEENGVIKKAPKTAVGGASGNIGGEEFDMVIKISVPYGEDLVTDYVSVVEGSMQNVMDALRERNIPKIKILSATFHDDPLYQAVTYVTTTVSMSSYSGSYYFRFMDGGTEISLGINEYSECFSINTSRVQWQ